MAATVRIPHWLNELSSRVGRKPSAMTNLSKRPNQDSRLVWWPSSHVIERELPALLERIAINVDVVDAVHLPVGEWDVPNGDLVVMGEPIPVTEEREVTLHEVEMHLTDGRTLVFEVYYPAAKRVSWRKIFDMRSEARWIDDGGQ